MPTLAPADYVFSVEILNKNTGLHEILGITGDENIVKAFLSDESSVYKVQVFTLGQMKGPTQTIISLEEFMEFQQ